jgi:DNA replication protein DnaC
MFEEALRMAGEQAQNTQTPISPTICSRCECEAEKIKDKIIGSKTYFKICAKCFWEIKNSYDEKFLRLRNRIDSRKNMRHNLEFSGVPERYLDCTFKNFIDRSNILQQIKNLNKTESCFIWSDKSGNGKTHLAVAWLRYHLWRGKNCLFTTAPLLIIGLRSSFDNELYSEEQLIEKYSSIPYLVVDDIGVEKNTEYAMQCWYVIVNNRYSEMKPTIYTSNYRLDEIASKLGNRIASRLSAGKVIKINDEDMRLKSRR